LSIAAILAAGLSTPVLAQDPEGACCSEGVAPTVNASKIMAVVCEDGLTQLSCLEPRINPVWGGAGSTCGAGPFATVEDCQAGLILLPVELAHFDATVDHRSVILVWSTLSETNNAGFSIEREIGRGQFSQVGFVEGHGTTDEIEEYTFSVGESDPGVHRFRLKQIDFDGTFEYSAVVEAAVTVPDRFLIESAYPNPFNPSTTLRFAVASEQMVKVRLVNSAGQSVQSLYSGTVAANQMQTLRINAEALPSGTYLVRFEGGNGFEATERIVLAK
jgi:hypothetical protein